jgi:hypothetical protein
MNMEEFKVLFLDCDGVLNDQNDMKVTGDNRPYFVLNHDKLDHLNNIISKTNCKIVLSSSWRMMDGGVETLEKFGIKIFDKTLSLSKPRGYEIQEWLDRNPDVTNYAILDDDGDMLIHQRLHFVQTDYLVGLNECTAYRTIQKLKKPITKSFDQLLDSIDGDSETIEKIKEMLHSEYDYRY